MTVDRTKFNEIQEIPKGGLLNIQRAAGGVLSFDDVEYVPGGGGGSLASLSDVNITSPQEGDLLRYTGGKWRNAAGALVKVLTATWSPADVTQDETVALFTIPAHAFVLMGVRYLLVGADSGATSDLTFLDSVMGRGAFPLDYGVPNTPDGGHIIGHPNAWDEITPVSWAGSDVIHSGTDETISAQYTASATPGATKPVMQHVVVCILGALP